MTTETKSGSWALAVTLDEEAVRAAVDEEAVRAAVDEAGHEFAGRL
ncbi:hypothetical protein ACIHCX_30170 [Streptomyces sp. NPDC052043]